MEAWRAWLKGSMRKCRAEVQELKAQALETPEALEAQLKAQIEEALETPEGMEAQLEMLELRAQALEQDQQRQRQRQWRQASLAGLAKKAKSVVAAIFISLIPKKWRDDIEADFDEARHEAFESLVKRAPFMSEKWKRRCASFSACVRIAARAVWILATKIPGWIIKTFTA